MLTKDVKEQLAHHEKNLLNLEETSDCDSGKPSSDTVSVHLSDIEDKDFD